MFNAQAFWALSRWAECEELLGDARQAARYRDAAAKLKHRYNQPTSKGGFWDTQHQCYAHWRDKDGSAHGTNLVVPVNFSAIGYGLCDDPRRRAAILDRVESLMCEENLFFWPLCFFPNAKEEGHPEVNWPFPSYENGDLFLAWGELGTRCYVPSNPGVALKYVKNVLTQYMKDGLAFQRYLRRSQTGEGKDILANNCSTIVGLYRNIYGLQPKYNRLYLEPHLTPELNGTHLEYSLRGKHYRLDLSVDDYALAVDNFTVRSPKAFAINVNARCLEYFNRAQPKAVLRLTASAAEHIELTVRSWPDGGIEKRSWSESCRKPGTTVEHLISGLALNRTYSLSRNGTPIATLRSDPVGGLAFDAAFSDSDAQNFDLEMKQ